MLREANWQNDAQTVEEGLHVAADYSIQGDNHTPDKDKWSAH